ncbi:hypothetical protein [Frigoribacterium sp. VKM Ac-2530]|uniref:hypothetical protein n=1 Tax=Frigoribacterium sp. VKM Ac-2530 TaxID=2783822 RepID=UPI00188BC565|nr:hypothetical protein [Frigoribacterium sp. VKM Ac-2530]MBF4578966.1 hypothetical protein [Frigoribacterium sp. VKM Ac-2530]
MPLTSTDAIRDQLGQIPSVELAITGTFAGVEDGLALVDIDGERQLVTLLGRYWPMPGETVRLLRVKKSLVALDITSPNYRVGRVTATGSPRCTVEFPPGSGVTQLMGYPKGAEPVVGDIVLIDWGSGGTVDQIVTTAAGLSSPTEPPPPPPPASGGRQVQKFTALGSGSFGGGMWIDDVYASASKKSLWVYGPKIADNIPDGATIERVRIYLPLLSDRAGNRPRIGTHGYGSRPGGAPAINNLTSVPNPAGWQDLPTSFGDLLKTGAQLGVGADGAGYVIWAGKQKDSESGALEITFTT